MKTLLRFDQGEVIIRENDVGETAYLIETGGVEVSKEIDGRQVVLAHLGPGAIFGEMSMIDDLPRSATVTAEVETSVSEIHRDQFFEHLQSAPENALDFLKAIFERLRDANVRILQLERQGGASSPTGAGAAVVSADPGASADVTVTLEGLTPEAVAVLPENPLRIDRFPYLIGRKSSDPLVNNDLMIADSKPWQVSRHHLKLVAEKGKVGAVDRGSTLGSGVDGTRIGGWELNPGPIYFDGTEGTLTLGTEQSPYRFKITTHAGS